MAFKKVKGEHHIKSFPIYNLAVLKGALVTWVPGASSISLFTTDTALPVCGIAMETTTTTSTATATTIQVDVTLTGDMLEGDIDEITDATTLTNITAANKSSFSDASFVCTKNDDVMIGAKFSVLSMNSTDHAVGAIITATDYATSGGVVTFAAMTTGFKTGDTIKLVSVSNRLLGTRNLAINSSTADAFTLDGSGAGDGDFFATLEVSDDGKKIRGFLTAGFDLCDAVFS